MKIIKELSKKYIIELPKLTFIALLNKEILKKKNQPFFGRIENIKDARIFDTLEEAETLLFYVSKVSPEIIKVRNGYAGKFGDGYCLINIPTVKRFIERNNFK